MKKFLKFSMLLLAVATVFTACGDKDNDSAEDPAGGGGDGGTHQAPSSKLTRMVMSGTYPDTADFTWEGDLLTQVIHHQGHLRCTFSYGSDGIASIHKYWDDGTLTERSEFFYTNGKISKVVSFDSDTNTIDIFYYEYTDNKITEIHDRSDTFYPSSYYLTWTGNNVTKVRARIPNGASGTEFREETFPVYQVNAKNPLYLPMGLYQVDVVMLSFGNADLEPWTNWCENMTYTDHRMSFDVTLNSEGYPTQVVYKHATEGADVTVTYIYAD